MARVFWDTNLFIYLFEQHPLHWEKVRDLWTSMRSRGDSLLTSTMTVGEILSKPLLSNRHAVYREYIGFFKSGDVTVVPFDFEAALKFAEIRRDTRIRQPDAIQLACAAHAGTDLFLTHDDGLRGRVVEGVTIITSLARNPF